MRLDIEAVKEFYRAQKNVWPERNEFYNYSRKEISRFINGLEFTGDELILNLGSGGNDYGLKNLMHHVDIVDTHILEFPKYTIADIEKLPFSNSEFSYIICVGSVLNYSNAMESIAEISRICKPRGKLIIEFECSSGLEYLRKSYFCQDASVASLSYCNKNHAEWLYSEDYVNKILKEYSFTVKKTHRFHYVSSLLCGIIKNENIAGHAAKLDIIARNIPILKKFSGNIMLYCIKN